MELIKSSKQCKKCKSKFYYTVDDLYWDEHGYGYSTRLVKCTNCGCANVSKYKEDYSLNVNDDLRFYEYCKK